MSVIRDFEASGAPDPGHVLAPESPQHESPSPELDEKKKAGGPWGAASLASNEDEDGRLPTDEERATLRLVPTSLPWTAYLICVVEFAERASYYSCVGIFNNFIQRPLPADGNGWGAPGTANGSAGALGLGITTATALTTLFSFLAYTIPIAGGILSDVKWGRFKTLWIGTLIGIVAHIILIIAAIPSVIAGGHAIAPFIIALLTLALASGLIKPTVSPLIADQAPIARQTISTLPSGERVILDPSQTLQRALLIFYWCINVGAFLRLGSTYAEKRSGFWPAYTISMAAYVLVPAVLLVLNKRVIKVPPQGTVVLDAIRVLKTALFKRSWDAATPSHMQTTTGSVPEKVTYDDDFVLEVKRTIKACKLFLFIPIYNLADGGLSTAITSMAAQMTSGGVPNDLLANFNALTIIILIPILNYGIYPVLRRHKMMPSAVVRMAIGMFLGALTMVVAAILQWQVYTQSPCGRMATTCDVVTPISLWVQIPLFSLPAMGEIMVNVTVYELAITAAPQRMKGLTYSAMLFMTALSSAIVLIISPSIKDPNLIWPFVGIACACFISGVSILFFFRDMHKNEGRDQAIGADRKIEGIVRPGDQKPTDKV